MYLISANARVNSFDWRTSGISSTISMPVAKQQMVARWLRMAGVPSRRYQELLWMLTNFHEKCMSITIFGSTWRVRNPNKTVRSLGLNWSWQLWTPEHRRVWADYDGGQFLNQPSAGRPRTRGLSENCQTMTRGIDMSVRWTVCLKADEAFIRAWASRESQSLQMDSWHWTLSRRCTVRN